MIKNPNFKLEVTGTDLTIRINDLEYGDHSIATIEYNILLPILEFKKIGLFLEQIVKGTTEDNEDGLIDKKFKITTNETLKELPILKMIVDDFTISIDNFGINTEFNIKISILADQLTIEKLKEISEVQKKTWVSAYNGLDGKEILELWDKKWTMIIEEM